MNLRKLVLFITVIVGNSFFSHADLSFEGHYQGKSLFVQNPEDEDGFGFCRGWQTFEAARLGQLFCNQ